MKTACLAFCFLLVAAAVASAGTTAAQQRSFADYGHPTLEAINDAYLGGEITEAEALLYRFYFVKDPAKLPAHLRKEGQPIKSATAILLEVYDRESTLPAEIRYEIAQYRVRPSGLPLLRVTDHYYIHYTLTGPNAVPYEGYVDAIEEACEASWQEYHVNMNWDLPPGDGAMGGGSDMIDCYIHDLGAGYLGMAEIETPVPGPPSGDWTGFFHVNRNIGSANVRRVTTAHEYMHIVQFGYRAFGARWYMENCAMMGEEWVYDHVNDYHGYLLHFFLYPYWTLTTFNGMYEYGGIVWPMYQSERFADELVEDIWGIFQWDGVTIWDAFDEALFPYGYETISAYTEFMRWCFYTRDRDDGMHFEEAGDWLITFWPDGTYSSYPTGELHPNPIKRPEQVGTSIMEFIPETGSTDNILVVDFDGPDCSAAVDLIAKRDGEDIFTEYYMTLDENGNGTIEIPDFDISEYVFMLASMSLDCGGAQDYSFWADTYLDNSDVLDDLEKGSVVRIYPNRPNPFSLRTTISYWLPCSDNVEVRIFDANGRTVRDLFGGHQSAGSYEMAWNGEDDDGNAVANGVYFAHVGIGNQELVREVTVIR